MKHYLCCLALLLSSRLSAEPVDFWVLTSLEPPFSQKNSHGQYEGLVIDLVQGILREASIEQQILAAPWPRIFKEASSKANVLIFALARTPERESQFYWITPISANIIGVFSRDPTAATITSLAQLKPQQSIGVMAGDYRLQIIQQAGINNIVEYENWFAAVTALLDGQIDNLFFSALGMQSICGQLHRDCTQVKRIITYQQITSYLALSKGSDLRDADLLSQAALRYKQSEEFTKVVNYWISEYSKNNGLTMHLDNLVVKLW